MPGRDIEYDGNGDGPPSELYYRNFQKMLRRSGKKALEEIEAALLAMPEKRLRFGYLAKLPEDYPVEDGYLPNVVSAIGESCVVGAVVIHKRTSRGEDRHTVMRDLVDRMDHLNVDDDSEEDAWDALEKTALAAKEVGIPMQLARRLSEVNDAQGSEESQEARHARVLTYVRWLREKADTPLPFKAKGWTGPVAT